MARLFRIILILVFLSTPTLVWAEAPSTMLRVMTYNIRSGARGIEDVLKTVEEKNPDILFLQEVHGPSFVHDFIDQAQYLGRQLDRSYIFSQTRLWMSGEYGIATFSRFPIDSVEKFPLPNLPGEEPEIFLLIQVQTPSGPLLLGNVHLVSLTKNKKNNTSQLRQEQASYIRNILIQRKDPILFGGDFNTFGLSKTKSIMNTFMVDLWSFRSTLIPKATFPADFPILRLDYLWARGPFVYESIEVLRSKASDHRPIYSEIRLLNL